MNERIRELAEQAGYTKDMFGVGHWDMPECQKFAELMVKEFETVAKNPRWYFPDQQDGWRDPINCVCKEMKKHFGVE